MSTERKQSAIKEVRDQLSLDYADGKYLNIVGANIGLTRPRSGFSDDSWRAIIKAIGLNFKQIKTKFEEVLAIFFGPRITVDTALISDVFAGQTVVLIEDSTDWPQLGTVIFDAGLSTEETRQYCFIDRTTNQMFLTEGLEFPHKAVVKDAELVLLAVDEVTNSRLILSSVSSLPSPAVVGNYSAVLGAGTDAEETVVISDVNYINRVVSLASSLMNTHNTVRPSTIRTVLGRTYNPVHPVSGLIQEQGLTSLTVADSRRFPASGDLLLGAAGPGSAPNDDVFIATGGSDTVIDTAIGTFEVGGHSGYRVVFAEDTVTAALRGLEATIVTNTGNQLVLNSTLPDLVVAGDTFRIRALVHYTSVDYNTNTFNLVKHIPNLSIEESGVLISDTVDVGSLVDVIQLTTGGLVVNAHRGRRVIIGGVSTEIISNTASSISVLPFLPAPPTVGSVVEILFDTDVELLEPLVKWNATSETLDVGQVKSPGTGWDVIQVDPFCVEIFVPPEIQDIKDLRSASYIHGVHISPPPATTLSDPTLVDDVMFNVVNPIDFPVVGVVSVGGSERVAYYNHQTYLTAKAASGDTSIQIPDSSRFPNIGDIIVDPGGVNQETVTISANDPVTNTLTISALVNDHLEFTKIRDVRFLIPNDLTLTLTHLAGDSVNLYQPPVGTTDLLTGNLWLIEDVFSGPYIYKPDELTWGGFGLKVFRTAPASRLPAASQAATESTSIIPGPVYVSIDQIPGKTAIEVEDASAFELVSFPYDVRAGINTGNQERLFVNDVNLRQRTFTTQAVASIVGDTSIEVVALNPTPAIPASGFPDANGYRVLIGKGLPTEEIAYVVDTSTGPDTLVFESPLTQVHSIGDSVELLADVLTVNPTADAHDGIVRFSDRSTSAALAAGNALTARWPVISATDRIQSEMVAPEIEEIVIDDPTNFPEDGGLVYLNFGRTAGGVEDVIPFTAEARSTDIAFLGTNIIEHNDPSAFPLAAASPLTPFVIVFDPGGLKEEILRVTGSSGPNQDLVLETDLRFTHPSGTLIRHVNSKEELLTYDTIVGNTLRFSPPIVLQFTHSPGENAILSLIQSVPSLDGYDFPFYLPPDLGFRLQSILDLVRAAGVAVKFIDMR